MTSVVTTPAIRTITTPRTRAQLIAGVLAGPLFVAVVVLQALSRDGFDPKRHPLSLLSLGEFGWIQVTNFIVAGTLALTSAFGLRRVLHPGRAGTWGPILIGIYGVGLIWGGVFAADPMDGFPVGTPLGPAQSLSWHGILHGIAPAAAALALLAATVVFARRLSADGERGWAAYGIVAAVIDLALTAVTFAVTDYRFMLAGGAVIWIWAAAVTGHLLRTRLGGPTPTRH